MAKHDPLRCRIDPCKVLPLGRVEILEAESRPTRSVEERLLARAFKCSGEEQLPGSGWQAGDACGEDPPELPAQREDLG